MLIMPKSDLVPEKHPFWAGDTTPNTHYKDDMGYKEIVDAWKQESKIPGRQLWFEVRITKAESSILISKKWWDDPMSLDKVFWVYQTPIPFTIEGKQWMAYALEFFECQRVMQLAIEKFGYNPFDPLASLLVPVDCVQIAWNETSNGFSDHNRNYEAPQMTSLEIDLENKMQEEVEDLLKNNIIDPKDMEDTSWLE